MLAKPAEMACRRSGIPMIIDMAEHYPATMRTFEKYQHGLMKFLVFHARVPDKVERGAVAVADGVFTVCEEQNRRLHECFGYPYDRMTVVHNTPDLSKFEAVRTGSRTPPQVLAYHGYVTAQRGLDRLILGFSKIADRHPLARLELAGNGPATADLVRLAAQSGVKDRVRFLGSYGFSDLVPLYSEADVGLLAYPIDESINHTIGNKLFDYLACGKPVVVSPAVPLRRVVQETGAGLVLRDCSPEAIAEGLEVVLKADPHSWSERGLTAARNRYNWARDMQTLLDFIARLC
jgi:glycosyltransferase involved in cell wall biosynthesis